MTRIESVKHIQKIVGANPDGILGNETLTKFQCYVKAPTKAIVAHFFGNMVHESGDFSITTESINYTTIDALRETWPTRFTSDELAKQYLRSPEKLGNFVYGGRMGNAQNEGYKYRGRGWMQTTGKESYIELSKFLGVDVVCNPELVAIKYPFESAIFMFNQKKLWSRVSTVSDMDIRIVRKLINGGEIGLDKVNPLVKKFYNMMK